MEQVLELKHIHYAYHNLEGETPALIDISFALNKGEFVSIVGPSGCGKSTLLSLIAGLITPEKGLIKINGKYLRESTTNVGYMLQHDELFEWRTIYNNVVLGLEVQHMLTARTRQRAHELLNVYGLSQFENARPSELHPDGPSRIAEGPLSSGRWFWSLTFCFWMSLSLPWIIKPG